MSFQTKKKGRVQQESNPQPISKLTNNQTFSLIFHDKNT